MFAIKKIVLIIPPTPWLISDTDIPSLGILYISSYLKKSGFETSVCDLSGIPDNMWKIPVGDIYGITCTTPHYNIVKQIIDLLKAREPNKQVIVGGAHPTTLPEHMLRTTKADICIIGEGEETTRLLMMGEDLKVIPNIAYLIDGLFKINERKLISNLDIIPYPDRDSIDMYKYLPSQAYKYLLGEAKETIVYTGRGCPYNCGFCASRTMHNGKVRVHSIDYVINEINMLKNKYGVQLIYFDDDTLVLNKKRMITLCQELKKINIKWNCLNRVDCCYDEVLKEMSAAGCVGVVIGFESGSNIILKNVNKMTTVEQAYDAIERLKKHNIKIRGQLVVGLPGETQETIEETANFIRKGLNLGIDKFGIHVFKPFPGCPIWINPEEFKYNLNKLEVDFDTFHTIGKPEEQLSDDLKIMEWYRYLKNIAGEHSQFNKQ